MNIIIIIIIIIEARRTAKQKSQRNESLRDGEAQLEIFFFFMSKTK